MTEKTEGQPRMPDYQWIPNKTNTGWTLSVWPFSLIIDYRPREPKPYVGSLASRLGTLRDFHAWSTPEEATKGMIEWGLKELSDSYHELAKLVTPQPAGGG